MLVTEGSWDPGPGCPTSAPNTSYQPVVDNEINKFTNDHVLAKFQNNPLEERGVCNTICPSKASIDSKYQFSRLDNRRMGSLT